MEIDIFLFGKPEWMIDLDKAAPEDIKDLGLHNGNTNSEFA
jgi:hypothetical protein